MKNISQQVQELVADAVSDIRKFAPFNLPKIFKMDMEDNEFLYNDEYLDLPCGYYVDKYSYYNPFAILEVTEEGNVICARLDEGNHGKRLVVDLGELDADAILCIHDMLRENEKKVNKALAHTKGI